MGNSWRGCYTATLDHLVHTNISTTHLLFFLLKKSWWNSEYHKHKIFRTLCVHMCVCNPVVQWAVEWLSNNSPATAVLPVGEAKTIHSSPMLLRPSLTLFLFASIFPITHLPSKTSPFINMMPFFIFWVCCWLYLFQIWMRSRKSLIPQTLQPLSQLLSPVGTFSTGFLTPSVAFLFDMGLSECKFVYIDSMKVKVRLKKTQLLVQYVWKMLKV